jgi:3-oxoacyl-(acyl-carrier-protein) synthase
VVVNGAPVPTRNLELPGCPRPQPIRTVPAPSPRPAFAGHARLRRTSPIAHYAVAAALEALGPDAQQVTSGALNLGVVLCVMCGCVNYSRRFYDEALKDPATASPLVFPETVFNAPASHLAALLGARAASYTLVGDQGTFLQGLSLAAAWLLQDRVDGCVVIGAEEMDWLTVGAARIFDPAVILSEGAGALYLRRGQPGPGSVRLNAVTEPFLFTRAQPRSRAAALARSELGAAQPHAVLCDGLQNAPATDRDEAAAWRDWPGDRVSPKRFLGEGFAASAAWQCVAAVEALNLNGYRCANVSVVGSNEQAIAAQFLKTSPAAPAS